VAANTVATFFMKIILLQILIIAAFSCFGQKTKYLVKYFYEQKSIVFNFSDSLKKTKIKISWNGNDSTANNQILDSIYLNMPSIKFNMETYFFILADFQTSKTFFKNKPEDTSTIHLKMHTPYTVYYANKKWTSLKNENISEIPTIKINAIGTKKRKKILGYECIKFITKDKSNKVEMIIWACKKLPKSLLPYTGLVDFKYGILEIENFKEKWHSYAIEIKKLKS
jgi:hypothetical protein